MRERAEDIRYQSHSLYELLGGETPVLEGETHDERRDRGACVRPFLELLCKSKTGVCVSDSKERVEFSVREALGMRAREEESQWSEMEGGRERDKDQGRVRMRAHFESLGSLPEAREVLLRSGRWSPSFEDIREKGGRGGRHGEGRRRSDQAHDLGENVVGEEGERRSHLGETRGR